MAFEDLVNQSKTDDGKYVDLVFTDLDPDTIYGLRFAWEYEDPSLGLGGISSPSDVFPLITNKEPDFPAPNFRSSDLTAKNGFLLINWDGNDLTNMPLLNFKQVNVWIKGGSFGAVYVKAAQSFTQAGLLTIPVNAGQYCVKLQAESMLGTLSGFSNEYCVEVYKSPKPVTNLQGRWVKDDLTSKTDALMITFTFDPTAVDATNSNTDADYFLITLTANSKTRTFWSPVNKSSTSQSFFLSATDNKASFGLFASQFEVFILVRNTFGQVSTLVNAQTLTYSTPLDTPVITATAGTLAYNVSYNNQTGKPFDNIYIFEDTGSGYSQVAQGTSNPIVVPVNNTLQRSVKAKFYDSNGGSTVFSNIVTVTPMGVVTLDTDGPPNVTTPTTSGGLDPLGTIGFNGYANISWTAVTTGGIRGYRIRYRPVTSPVSSYAYVDSPGTGTSYRLSGLNAGVTYEIAVATYDEYNNTSTSYVAGTNVSISGTPYIASTVDVTGYFSSKANANDAASTAFKFGYGVDTGKRGLVFNTNNYWYIDSDQGASLKVGGADNFMSWNGSSLIVTGDLRAKKGSFSGNVNIATGASLYSGTLTGNTVTSAGDTGGTLSGAGYVLNTTGLKFNSATITDITAINAATGKLTTALANIGGWEVDASTISKNGITLNSTGKIIANSGAYYIGIEPKSASVDDIVLWAGQSATGGTSVTGANFRVTAGGKLYATGAVIEGNITLTNGSGLSTIIDSKASIFRSASMPSGSSYKNGDLWIDTDDNNKVYQWSTLVTPAAWVVVQDSAAALAAAAIADGKSVVAKNAADAAAQLAADADDAAGIADGKAVVANLAATAAASAAAVAAEKAKKFDSTTGNLILGLTLDNNSASIYSSKSSYTDTTNGWYMGWKSVGAGSYTPAIYLGGADTYLKYSTDDGLVIKGNISATTGFIGGWSIGTDSIYKGAISLNSATGTISGATITGGIIYSGSASISNGAIVGASLTTAGSGYGAVRINGSNNTIELLNSSNAVATSLFTFADGSESIFQHGSKTALGYPASSSYLSLNPYSTTLGYTDANGNTKYSIVITSAGDIDFRGKEVRTEYGGAIGGTATDGLYYMRNIGMGTGAKTTSHTDGLRGDIWIQYA